MNGGADEERNPGARGGAFGEPGQQEDAAGLPFKKLVSQPKESVKDINEYFSMGFTPDVKQALGLTPNDRKIRKKVITVVPDEWFT